MFEYVKSGGQSYLLVQSTKSLYAYGASGAYDLALGFSGLVGITGRMSVSNFDNWAWIANQWNVVDGLPQFYRYDGGVALEPAQMLPPPNVFTQPWYTLTAVNTGSSPVLFATLGGWRYRAAYLSDRNVVGPSAPKDSYFFGNFGADSIQLNITPSVNNANVLGSGISYLLIFRDTIGLSAALVRDNNAPAITTAVWKYPINGITPVSFFDTGLGYTSNGSVTNLLSFTAAFYRPNEFFPFGPTVWAFQTGISTFGGFSGQIINTAGTKQTGYPQIISAYNNMMFYAGFPLTPSTVFWSNLGFPEQVDNENFNEVRTNDGEVITAMIPYDGQLIVSKNTALFVVTGDDPDTVSFFEKNTTYGFINNQAVCTFENYLWGVDGEGKGIINYNGANTDIISDKVQDIFQRINLNAAKTEAFMLHVKSRNEVWCGIPVDGSSLVNVLIVYDYVAKCWTTFEGLNPTAVTIARGTLTLPRPIMGASNGTIRYLNASNLGTEAVTTAVRFPFVTNFGWSSTETYRRLFVDTDPILGTTYTFAVNCYLNQSSTSSLSTTMATPSPSVTPQQGCINFGLPGKGLSVELIEGSSLPLRLNGYTIESRFQRSV